MQKLDSLQLLRALAAVMVVFFHAHSYVLPVKISNGAHVSNVFNMGYAGVEIFFVISGFIMAYVHRNDVGSPSRFLSFAYKRVVRIYPVYWLILFSLVGLYFIVPDSGPDNARNIPQIALSATLLPLPFTPVMEVAWTLQFEMFFYLLFSSLILNRTIGKTILLLWCGGCLVNYFVNTEIFPLSFIFSAYNLLFLLGGLAARLYISGGVKHGAYWAALGFLLFLITGLAEAYHVIEWYKPFRTIVYGVGAFLMLGGLTVKLPESSYGIKLFSKLGDASYSIYLVHAPCLMILVELLDRVGLLGVVSPSVMFFAVSLVSIAAAVIFYFLIESNIVEQGRKFSDKLGLGKKSYMSNKGK